MYKSLFYFIILLFTLISLGCSASREISGEVKIIPRAEWNAAAPAPFKIHVPERITIHHEGTIFKKESDAPLHIKNVQTWGMSSARFWSDIPYHFLIDPKGNIYEGRNVFTTGETATEYDPEGHLLITCLGNFEEQEVTAEQLNSLINLTAYLSKKYNISPETIASHKDYAQTACPGKNLYKFIENNYIKDQIKQKLN